MTTTAVPAELSDRDVAIWRAANRRLRDAFDRYEHRCDHSTGPRAQACDCHLIPERSELTQAKREYDAALGLIPLWRAARDAARRAG